MPKRRTSDGSTSETFLLTFQLVRRSQPADTPRRPRPECGISRLARGFCHVAQDPHEVGRHRRQSAGHADPAHGAREKAQGHAVKSPSKRSRFVPMGRDSLQTKHFGRNAKRTGLAIQMPCEDWVKESRNRGRAAVSIVKGQSAWKRVESNQGPSIPFQVRGVSRMTFILPPAAASSVCLAQKVAIISGLRAAVQESPVRRTLLTPMILSANKKSHSNNPPRHASGRRHFSPDFFRLASRSNLTPSDGTSAIVRWDAFGSTRGRRRGLKNDGRGDPPPDGSGRVRITTA